MVRSMTQGKPIRLILSFSIMVLLGDLFQQFYNIMDAVIVGRSLGPEALAAVGATSSVQFLILGFGMGICMGFAIPISQRFGAQDYPNVRRYIRHGWILIAVIAVLFTTVCSLLTGPILRLLSVGDNIFPMTYSYLFIIYLGIPCTLLYNYVANI
ncbi:MAG: MATE family efflux transporter, partial [Lachnospiraceae bacterium]|nr:MATE family efflux transporter [Lachnospiraceae bacterium]